MNIAFHVRRVVICVPPSVVRQWQDEMEARFGLPFVVYDREYVARVRQERGYAVNPWKTHTRFILSHALVRDEVRAKQLVAGLEVWRQRKKLDKATFAGLPYTMLHSLAHLMIAALSLDCGYSASAIRERIYAGESGHGILLYTGTPGSEGSLGGLVEMGKNIGRHLERALELGRLCSNDPVCAQHEPADLHEERFLHGAACHGCLLIAETSCERRNELLDRALVVPTVTMPGAAFFRGDG